MHKIWQLLWSVSILCASVACSSGTEYRSVPDPIAPDNGGEPPAARGEAGLHWEDGALTFRTEPFDLPPGEESYRCWAVNLEEDVKINAFHFAGASAVHHFMLAQTTTPEPDGWSVCEDLLKPTWRPLFTAGAGANDLELPDGVAHELTAGAQIVVQLHLLNTGTEAINGITEVAMEATDQADTEAVQIGGFGSFKIALPPHQVSSITSECTLPASSRLVALMPHMHQSATSMQFEMGSSKETAQVIYSRDHWDFGQQTIDSVDMQVQEGQYARVTCNYDNQTDQTINYGESSFDEMCFLGVFWVGTPMNCVIF